jgi:hypothetical protein
MANFAKVTIVKASRTLLQSTSIEAMYSLPYGLILFYMTF